MPSMRACSDAVPALQTKAPLLTDSTLVCSATPKGTGLPAQSSLPCGISRLSESAVLLLLTLAACRASRPTAKLP